MFLRILKKDLQERIGLNIVLFVFMVVASTLVVISTLQLYANWEGYDRTFKVCNSSDVFLVNNQSVSERSKQIEEMNRWLSNRIDVKNIEYYETIRFNSKTLDFDNYDERNSNAFKSQIYYLIMHPIEQNLVLDMDDRPFCVENGCIAIPKSLQILTGAEIGDKLRVTSQMGYIYEFKISHVYKDPAAMQFCRLIVSDADYKVLYDESPMKYDFYAIQQDDGSNLKTQLNLIRDFIQEEEDFVNFSFASARDDINDNVIMARVVTLFMSLISIFMILLILMTIRFTLISAIKREEREIGMMKAIGVNSLYYKWLFAAKYIAFVVVGGVSGAVFGIPINNIMLKQFSFNTIYPPRLITIVIAIVTVLFLAVFMILFIFVAMRRIDKVNVMDAFYGENRGERFKKMTGFFLNKRRHIDLSLFLAIADLYGRIKRYIFLMVAYMFGISIILILMHLKDSVVSEEFYIKYGAISKLDFEITLSPEMRSEYKARGGSERGLIKLINEDFISYEIPAVIEIFDGYRGTMYFEGKEYYPLMYWGIEDTADVTYRQGSIPPRLYNEVALDYYTAYKEDIEIGDIISIKYDKRTEDNLTSKLVIEDFIVTGLFDYIGNGVSRVIMGNEFNNAVSVFTTRFKAEILAPEAEKPYYIEKMREIYGIDCVQDQEQLINNLSGNWNIILSSIRNTMSVVVVMLLVLITILYQNIYMEEEISSVALLKSMGIDNRSIKKWHYLRVVILGIGAFLMAVLFTVTFGNLFMKMAFEVLLKMAGFSFRVNLITCYILLPIVLLIIVTLVLALMLKPIEKIQIWRIRNE